MKKTTQEEFIELARKVHGDEYSYDKVDFINTKKPVIITCSRHGDFEVIPSVHLRGAKCRECKKIPVVSLSKTNEFIERSKSIHGDEFDYSKVEYINDKTPVTIICRKHGEFQTIPAVHKRGYKCPVCKHGGTPEEKLAAFLEKCRVIHKDRGYDYSKVSFKINTDKITIICPTHGEFSQVVSAHLQGQKCPTCAKIEGAQLQRFTNEELLLKVTAVHSDKYEYDFSEYVNINSKIKIKCNKHGWFYQRFDNHIGGSSCPECSLEASRFCLNEFIEKSRKIHKDKYDYSLCKENVNSKTKMDIICPKHGVFKQSQNEHMTLKAGCPSCANTFSRFEQWVGEVIFEITGDKATKKKLSNNKEVDVVYGNIGFEANGLLYHCEGLVYGSLNNGGKDRYYHLDKTNQAKEDGIKLYHIFENEYLEKPDLLRNKILNACGLNLGKKGHARSCKIIEISHNESFNFLEKYHIQGGDTSPIRYGAVLDGEMVGVMTFKRTSEAGVYDLNRYATNYNYHIRGLASKMLRKFERDSSPSKIKTFADIRWTPDGENNLYTKLGFKLIEQQPPVYHYYNKKYGTKLFNRMRYQKHKILKEYPELDSSMTEKEMMIYLGFDRVWDCGNWKFEKTYE